MNHFSKDATVLDAAELDWHFGVTHHARFVSFLRGDIYQKIFPSKLVLFLLRALISHSSMEAGEWNRRGSSDLRHRSVREIFFFLKKTRLSSATRLDSASKTVAC